MFKLFRILIFIGAIACSSTCLAADSAANDSIIQFHYIAFALIFCGFLLVLFEILLTTFGVLGVIGTLLFCIGIYDMLNPLSVFYHTAQMVVIAFGVIAVILFVLLGWYFFRARKLKVVTGKEELLGATGEVVLSEDHKLMAMIHGELWQIHADVPLQIGQYVKVINRKGLVLIVQPISRGR